jgi:hypothetical protein
MNPRRLHSDTIFSMSGLSFGSAIRTGSVLEAPRHVKKAGGRKAHASRPGGLPARALDDCRLESTPAVGGRLNKKCESSFAF